MDCRSHCPKLPWMIDFNSNDTKKVLDNQYEAAFQYTQLDHLSKLTIRSRPSRFRATQFICTITPNTPVTTINDLISEGMAVALIAASKTEKTKEILNKIKSLVETYSRNMGRIYPLGIGLEIKGPEIRIGTLKGTNKRIFLEKGRVTKLTTRSSYEEFVCEDMIYVDYEKFPEVVHPGDKVVLDNGSVTLTAMECVESIIKCIVDKAGMLISNASVTVPNVIEDVPMLSASDKDLMKLAVGECIEYLFVSGIRNKQEILDIREHLGIGGETIQIIAKVENEVAVDNINEIIKYADGIFIDCERLLVESPREKIFLIQKSIVAKCNCAGKPAIVTSSISDPRFLSKAEISDIANAVIGGSDALLIPRDACCKEILKGISIICKEAEPATHQKQVFEDLLLNFPHPMEAIYSLGISVVEAASTCKAAAIICLTSSGRTAKVISRFKPRCPILVVTRYSRVARVLSIYRGIEALIYLKPFCGEWQKDVDLRTQLGVTYGKYIGYIRMGDAIITVSASRPEGGLANTMKVVYASEFDTLPQTEDPSKPIEECKSKKISQASSRAVQGTEKKATISDFKPERN